MCPRTSGLVWKFMVSLLSFYPKKKQKTCIFVTIRVQIAFNCRRECVCVCANVTWFIAFVWPLTVFILCWFVKTMDDGKVIVLQNNSNNGPNNSDILNRDILEISANSKKCWYATIITLIISFLFCVCVLMMKKTKKKKLCADTEVRSHTSNWLSENCDSFQLNEITVNCIALGHYAHNHEVVHFFLAYGILSRATR